MHKVIMNFKIYYVFYLGLFFRYYHVFFFLIHHFIEAAKGLHVDGVWCDTVWTDGKAASPLQSIRGGGIQTPERSQPPTNTYKQRINYLKILRIDIMLKFVNFKCVKEPLT